MALNLTAVHALAETVLGCVCQALETAAAADEEQPGCPCRAFLSPGPPAWECCEEPCGVNGGAGGQLTVHVARIYPTSSFPVDERVVQGGRNCQTPTTTAVELVVTLLRCTPTMDERGGPPAPEDLTAAARTVHVDTVTIYNALLCCLPTTGTRRRGPTFFLGAQKVLEQQGGCTGVEQRVTVALPGCGCPTEESP
ncbi:hypothetical protein [Streptomyces sp. NPDC055055]